MFSNLKNPVLLWSAGLDSTLILAMMIEAQIPFDIVQLGRDMWTKEQKRRADDLIRKWNLKVFSYPPQQISFIGDSEQISLVREYVFMGAKLPLVSDVIDGSRCIAELDSHKAYAPPMKWQTVIIGSRKDDKHYAFENQVIPAERWKAGETEFYAPLYDWTRDEVKAELKRRGLPSDEVIDIEDTGNVALCHSCLHGVETYCPKENSIIPPIQWSPAQNLAAFQSVYGVSQ